MVGRRVVAPLQIRSMNDPRPGWTLEQALDLLAQGYTPAHVEHVTGYAARHIEVTAARNQSRR